MNALWQLLHQRIKRLGNELILSQSTEYVHSLI